MVVYGEPLSPERLAGFALIWLALLIYTADGVARMRSLGRLAAAAEGR